MTDLGDIAAALGRLGYQAVPSAHADDELELQLSGDEPGETRATAVRLTTPSGAGTARLLMFSTSFPFGAAEKDLSDVRLAAAECTQYLVLGHFEVDDDGSPHLRYSTLVEDAGPPTDAVLSQIVGLLDFEQQHFGDYLERICSGDVTIEVFAELVALGEASGLD